MRALGPKSIQIVISGPSSPNSGVTTVNQTHSGFLALVSTVWEVVCEPGSGD